MSSLLFSSFHELFSAWFLNNYVFFFITVFLSEVLLSHPLLHCPPLWERNKYYIIEYYIIIIIKLLNIIER